MNPEVTIKISTTIPESIVVTASPPTPVPLEQLGTTAGMELPVPSKTTIETATDENLPVPLPLDRLEAAISEGVSMPTPMEKIAIVETLEPISMEELAAMTGKLSSKKLPEPEEIHTLAKKKDKS